MPMKSQAGRLYDSLHSTIAMSTRQRFKSYRSKSTTVKKRKKKSVSLLEHNSREKRDSFILRVTNEPVVNTNYFPRIEKIQLQLPRQIMPKAAFERIIGDVRTQDYSVPLSENCNHRCKKAHEKAFETLPNKIDTSRKLRLQRSLDSKSTLDPETNLGSSLDASKSQRSTYHSLMKKKSLDQKSFELLPRIQKEGINLNLNSNSPITPSKKSPVKQLLDIGEGHQYLKHVLKREKSPEPYEIENSNESLIRKSMAKPRGEPRFYLYRQKTKTRYDRADPYWNSTIENDQTTGNQIRQVEFDQQLDRRSFSELGSYPFRQNM